MGIEQMQIIIPDNEKSITRVKRRKKKQGFEFIDKIETDNKLCRLIFQKES